MPQPTHATRPPAAAAPHLAEARGDGTPDDIPDSGIGDSLNAVRPAEPPEGFVSFNGDLYFSVVCEGQSALYRLEGGAGWPLPVDESIRNASDFALLDGDLYFVASPSVATDVRAIYKMDRNSNKIRQVADFDGFQFNPGRLTAFDGSLFFVRFDEELDSYAFQLFKLDADIHEVSVVTTEEKAVITLVSHFCIFKGDLYFEGFTPRTGRELFRIAAGTGAVTVFDFEADPWGLGTYPVAAADNTLIVARRLDKDGGLATYSATGVPNSVTDFRLVDESGSRSQSGAYLDTTGVEDPPVWLKRERT